MPGSTLVQSLIHIQLQAYNMLGFPVFHCLPEFVQTHVHWVSDAFQSSHPLSPPSSPALNLSQHQGLFQWVGSSHQVAKSIKTSASASVLPVNIQGWFPLGLTGCISLQSKGHSGVFSSTTIRKHGLFRTQPFFVVQLLQPCMTTGKTIALTIWTIAGKVISLLFNMLSRFVCPFTV